MDGATQTKEYLKINPKGRVPTLDIEGSIITEVPAMLTYFSLVNPNIALMGTSQFELIRSIEWVSWLSRSLEQQKL